MMEAKSPEDQNRGERRNRRGRKGRGEFMT